MRAKQKRQMYWRLEACIRQSQSDSNSHKGSALIIWITFHLYLCLNVCVWLVHSQFMQALASYTVHLYKCLYVHAVCLSTSRLISNILWHSVLNVFKGCRFAALILSPLFHHFSLNIFSFFLSHFTTSLNCIIFGFFFLETWAALYTNWIQMHKSCLPVYLPARLHCLSARLSADLPTVYPLVLSLFPTFSLKKPKGARLLR